MSPRCAARIGATARSGPEAAWQNRGAGLYAKLRQRTDVGTVSLRRAEPSDPSPRRRDSPLGNRAIP